MILARKTSGQSLAHADIKFDHHVVSANKVPLKIPFFSQDDVFEYEDDDLTASGTDSRIFLPIL